MISLKNVGLVCTLVAVPITGCSTQAELELKDSGAALAATPVEGTWESACAASGTGFAKTSLTYGADGTLTNVLRTYTDAACGADTITNTRTELFSYQLISKVNDTEEKYKINYQSLSLKFLPTETQATTYNQSGFCDYAEWQPNVEFDRTDKECHSKTLTYDLVKIDANVMTFGSKTGSNSGSSNDSRPILIDTSSTFTKI